MKSAPHSHSAPESGAEEHHAQHCHSDAASCSDVPLTTLTGIALLAAWLGIAASSGVGGHVMERASAMVGRALSVESPPPRAVAIL